MAEAGHDMFGVVAIAGRSPNVGEKTGPIAGTAELEVNVAALGNFDGMLADDGGPPNCHLSHDASGPRRAGVAAPELGKYIGWAPEGAAVWSWLGPDTIGSGSGSKLRVNGEG